MLGSIDVFVKQLNRIVKIHTALCRSWGVLNSVLTVFFLFFYIVVRKCRDRADILISEIKTLCLSHLWQRIRFGASSTAAVAGYTCCLMWPLSSTLACIQLHWSGVCSSAGVCTRGPLHWGAFFTHCNRREILVPLHPLSHPSEYQVHPGTRLHHLKCQGLTCVSGLYS